MKNCRKCFEQIPYSVVIDGKRVKTGGRFYCLNCSPFKSQNGHKIRSTELNYFYKDKLTEAVKSSLCYADVMNKLQLHKTGCSYRVLKKRIKFFELDISHFTGRACCGWKQKTLSEILVENSNYSGTNGLKKRLFKEGVFERKCYRCDIREWQGEPAPIQLHHINGVRNDNRVENITMLCYNCHGLTPNYAGRNIHKVPVGKKVKPCLKCGLPRKGKRYCKACWDADQNNPFEHNKYEKLGAIRPTKDELSKLLWEVPADHIAKQYKVSDKAVEKWTKNFGLSKPPRGYWQKRNKGVAYDKLGQAVQT